MSSGPVFMTLIEKTFGKEQPARTWDTVGEVVRAAPRGARSCSAFFRQSRTLSRERPAV